MKYKNKLEDFPTWNKMWTQYELLWNGWKPVWCTWPKVCKRNPFSNRYSRTNKLNERKEDPDMLMEILSSIGSDILKVQCQLARGEWGDTWASNCSLTADKSEPDGYEVLVHECWTEGWCNPKIGYSRGGVNWVLKNSCKKAKITKHNFANKWCLKYKGKM